MGECSRSSAQIRQHHLLHVDSHGKALTSLSEVAVMIFNALKYRYGASECHVFHEMCGYREGF